MAIYGRVGNGSEVHQIGAALFEKDKAEGHSICGVEGAINLVITAVPTCQGCRDKKIENEMGRLLDEKKARKKCQTTPSVRS
jgi:hypothetical protein